MTTDCCFKTSVSTMSNLSSGKLETTYRSRCRRLRFPNPNRFPKNSCDSHLATVPVRTQQIVSAVASRKRNKNTALSTAAFLSQLNPMHESQIRRKKTTAMPSHRSTTTVASVQSHQRHSRQSKQHQPGPRCHDCLTFIRRRSNPTSTCSLVLLSATADMTASVPTLAVTVSAPGLSPNAIVQIRVVVAGTCPNPLISVGTTVNGCGKVNEPGGTTATIALNVPGQCNVSSLSGGFRLPDQGVSFRSWLVSEWRVYQRSDVLGTCLKNRRAFD